MEHRQDIAWRSHKPAFLPQGRDGTNFLISYATSFIRKSQMRMLGAAYSNISFFLGELIGLFVKYCGVQTRFWETTMKQQDNIRC
jgi:hypothetical protein